MSTSVIISDVCAFSCCSWFTDFASQFVERSAPTRTCSIQWVRNVTLLGKFCPHNGQIVATNCGGSFCKWRRSRTRVSMGEKFNGGTKDGQKLPTSSDPAENRWDVGWMPWISFCFVCCCCRCCCFIYALKKSNGSLSASAWKLESKFDCLGNGSEVCLPAVYLSLLVVARSRSTSLLNMERLKYTSQHQN